MYSRDTAAEISPNRQFPLGDITDTRKEEIANDWLNTAGEMDSRYFMSRIQMSYKPTPIIAGTHGYQTCNAAVNLCRTWDAAKGDKRNFALTGYIVSMAFNNEVHYLPSCKMNLTAELNQMQRPDEQRFRAQIFAQTAWRGMQQYPNVHDKFERLLEHSQTRFEIQPYDNREYFQAGMALTYILSATARLKDYIPDFTCMTDEKMNLRTTPFSKFFSTAVSLAPDVILPD